jgi:hypothetical protein
MKSRIIILISLILVAPLFLSAKEVSRNSKEGWDSREHFYKSKDSFSAYEIEYKGKILVSDNDKDIKSISPDGYLRISQSSFGNSRKIVIESDSKGNLTKTFFDGRNEEAFSPEGEEWLQEILIDVIRKTGIGGTDRIMRIYNKGGVSGVLDEIENFDKTGSYSYYKSTSHALIYFESIEYSGFNAKFMYYKTLVNDVKLNDKELIKVLKSIPEISSNSTKGTLLREILSKYELNSYSMEKFLDATESLSYNTERGNVLRAFMNKYKITTENSGEFFDIIDGMSVNTEKGNVIKFLLETQKLDKKVLAELINTVDDFSFNTERAAIYRLLVPQVVGNDDLTSQLMMATNHLSDSYRYLREEIFEYLAKGNIFTDKTLSKSAVLNLLDIALTYDANTKKSTSLRKVHGSLTNDKEVMKAYFNVIRSMDLEEEAYNLMLELVRMHKFDSDSYLLYLETTEELADDDLIHGASALLRAVVKDLPNEPAVLEAFFEALEEVDHNSGKEEIIRMFCQKGKLDKRTTVYLLKAVDDIDVDVEKATSLIRIKEVMPKNDSEITVIFNSIADDIKSDYEYERALN